MSNQYYDSNADQARNPIRAHLGFGHWCWLVRQIDTALTMNELRRLAFIIEHLEAVWGYIVFDVDHWIEDLIIILRLEYKDMLYKKDCRPPLDAAPTTL